MISPEHRMLFLDKLGVFGKQISVKFSSQFSVAHLQVYQAEQKDSDRHEKIFCPLPLEPKIRNRKMAELSGGACSPPLTSTSTDFRFQRKQRSKF